MAAQILYWVRNCLALVRLAAEPESGSKPPHVRTGSGPKAAQSAVANSDAIRELLAQLRAAEIDATAGMIQMVQLGDVRKAFGDQWPKMAETAMAIAEALLRDRLDQSEIFTRYLDYGFVVVFTSSTSELAERRAEALSQEISHLLLKKQALKGAFGAQQVTGRVSELTKSGGDDPLETMTLELDARSQSKSQQNGTTPISGGTNSAPRPKAKTTAPGPSKPQPAPQEPPPERKAPAAIATPDAPPVTKKKPAEPALVAMYQPMLLVPKHLVGISVGVPRRRGSDGEWLTGHSAYTPGLGGDHNLSLDLFLCKRVVADLQRMAKSGAPVIVASMVRLESLKASSEFVEIYDQLTEAERSRLILEIVSLDTSTPVSKIQDALGRYRNITKNIVVQLDLGHTEFREFAAARIGVVGCDLKRAAAKNSSTSRIPELVNAFGSRVQDAGLRCSFHGVDDAETYAAAVAVSAQYISGEIIGPLVDGPFGPYPFTAPPTAASSDAA